MTTETEIAKCHDCPRENAEPRLRAIENAGAGELKDPANPLPPPAPYVIETIMLCDNCSALRDDVL